jgi:hypothetical protein
MDPDSSSNAEETKDEVKKTESEKLSLTLEAVRKGE